MKGTGMRTGKISENVLKRSVLRQIGNRRKEVVKGAEPGEDCAFLAFARSEGPLTAVSTQTVSLPVKKPALLAITAAANNLAAAGAVPAAATLAVTLPEGAEESLLRELMGQAEDCCRRLNIQIAGGHTEVTGQVLRPVVTATVMGQAFPHAAAVPPDGLDIVISKWAGIEGTFLIAQEKEGELSERYPAGLLLLAKEQEKYLSVASEAAIALKSGVYAMHDGGNGGIFGALWELSRKLSAGLCVDLKKIPIRQETIEVCEFYDLNPYQLLAGGSLIMVSRDGPDLARQLEAAGIPAVVVGTVNNGNDKLIVNGDETRYLEMPTMDEIYKISFA